MSSRNNNAQLFNFLKEEKMTDVTLTAGGKQIKAHKLILASASNYFEKLFTTLGQQHPVIVLKDVSVRQLSLILEYVYLGQCDLEPDDVKEFKRVAASMEIKVELNFPDVTSSNVDDDGDISYEDLMETANYLTGARRSCSIDAEPPNKKMRIKQEATSKKTKAASEKSSPTIPAKAKCSFCDRELRKRDLNYHTRHCWKNPERIVSNCVVCQRSFELAVSCKLHERKEHGLHTDST